MTYRLDITRSQQMALCDVLTAAVLQNQLFVDCSSLPPTEVRADELLRIVMNATPAPTK